MKQEDLNKITHTIEGDEVKNLKWKALDNIIVGLVKCPILGKPNLHDGFISGMWKANGQPTNKIKGREDLRLKIN
jgi:hypothetical protein